MRPFEQRPSGLSTVGDLPWGSHFCVFYALQRELLEVLVPFVRAGLECNELCSWQVRAPLTLEEATSALSEAVPELATYLASGQLQLLPQPDSDATPDETMELLADRATLAGFDGVRLVRHASSEPGTWEAETEALRRLNIIAAFLVPRAHLGPVVLMQLVQAHRFALVFNAGRWEVLQGSEARTAREALLRSEEKIESLFRNMSEGVAYHRIVLDGQGRPCDYVFLQINAAFERLTGLSADAILGRRVTQVIPGIETDPADWIGTYGKVALTGEPVHFESRAVALDKWFGISAFSPHKGYFAVTFADITDRKRAEAQRRAAEERLRVTLRSIGDAVIATDTEGCVTLMNGVAESLTGWSEAEARGRPLAEVFRIINEDTGAAAEDPVRKVIESGCIVGLANHTALIAKDGRVIAVADSAAPVRGGMGLLGVVLVFRDVTTARQVEQERELTIEFLRLVNAHARLDDLIHAAVSYFQQRSGCEAVGLRLREGDDFPYCEARGFSSEFLVAENHLCERDAAGKVKRDRTGGPRLECRCGAVILGRTDPRKPFHTEGGSFWTNDTTGLLATTSDEDRKTRNRCRDEGYESVALIPLRVGEERLGLLQLNGRRRGMFSPGSIALWERLAGHFAVAISRSRAEHELARANQRLQSLAQELKVANESLVQSDRRKNEFLAVLSHELRNPLAPITNGLHVMERAAPGSDQARRAKEVLDRQVGHLSHLVDDLLDLTRVSRNKIHLARRRIDLCDVVRRSLEDQRSVFERAAITLECNVPAAPLFVNADETRIAQIVCNLLQNAAKFTARGGRARIAVSSEPAGGQVWLSVADTGVGMAADTLAGLFQPFMQADKTLDRSKGGLGLGLALVKGLVELHGGTVSARSEGLGKGAEFVVRLPLDGPARAQAEREPGPGATRPMRVLIIEDNVDAAESLRDVLELEGHTVGVAHSGPEGIDKARALIPELILCDIGLPGMDGFEVARVLRADAALARTQLVALSGYALPEDLERAAKAGFQSHLVKPVRIETLVEMLRAQP